MPEISVIVATVGRPERLEQLLDALKRQDLDQERFEVVIAIDGSHAGSVEVLERWKARLNQLRWSASERRQGPAAARNRAWRAATADLIAMTDDDCLPQPGWLSAFIEASARHPDCGVLLGKTVTDTRRLTPFSHYVENLEGEGHQTCNSAYQRQVLERIGGFDERFPVAYLEDTDLYCRALQATNCTFVASALVVHPPREVGVLDLAKTARKYESDFIFHHKDPELYRSRHGGQGPLSALLWTLGVKHQAKQLLGELRRCRRTPGTYLRYLAAMFLFELILYSTVWRCFWKYRALRDKGDSIAAAGAS